MSNKEDTNSPMVLILPPEHVSKNDEQALLLIKRIAKMLSSRYVRKYLDKSIEKGDTSVRRIQTGRYELFVKNAADKGSHCFDQLLTRNHYSIDDKQVLVGFATRQAMRDTRLDTSTTSYKFANFSIILTYEQVEQQAQHIDCLTPNHQFGMLLTENSPATLVYQTDSHITTVHDVEKLWNRWNADIDILEESMPKNLVRAFEQSLQATCLIADFGDVLYPEKEMKEVSSTPNNKNNNTNIPPGSLFSLPGNVIHAGPGSNDYRAVLFFSACPSQTTTTTTTEQYHPDTQYTGIFLCGQFVMLLWRMDGMGLLEREFLLRMLVKYMQQSRIKRIWSHHFDETSGCRAFMEMIESETLKSEVELEAYIKKTARNADLCGFNIEDDFDIISHSHLYTKWDDVDCKLEVYRREADGKILVHYPQDVDGSNWEGTDPTDNYHLVMRSNKKFDGVNGKLLATDGEEIKCYCKQQQSESSPDSTTEIGNLKKKRRKG